jgi:sigma-B regulation protein RsbU (phosphoserine phosphatase)
MDLGFDSGEVSLIEEILTVGSKIYFQTRLVPLFKLQTSVKEFFLTFKTTKGKTIPVLLNAVFVIENNVSQLHLAGIRIDKRHKFEADLIAAKNEAIFKLSQNPELQSLKDEQKKASILLEILKQQISRMTSEQLQIDKVLSHDLQEPLRKISLFANMIETTDHPTAANLNKIRQSVDRLRHLLSRMQRLHALDFKKLNLEEIALHEILINATKEYQKSNLKIKHPKEYISFPADKTQLTNFFKELIDNSVKFNAPERQLEISIVTDTYVQNSFIETENKYQYENYVRITYTDNGNGFENIYSNSVFDLFSKIHLNDGFGIGLTISKKIIELHKGKISVSSEINQGTTFIILLPLNR